MRRSHLVLPLIVLLLVSLFAPAPAPLRSAPTRANDSSGVLRSVNSIDCYGRPGTGAFGSVTVRRNGNQLSVEVQLRGGLAGQTFSIELWEAGPDCFPDNDGDTGVRLTTDAQGNADATVTLDLPHPSLGGTVLGDGQGSEQIVVALDISLSQGGGDTYAIEAIDLPQPAVIAGTIRDAQGQPVAGVTVDVGGGMTTTTQSDGTYRIPVPSGTYTVTPRADDLNFIPPSRVVIVPPNPGGVDFTREDLIPAKIVPYIPSAAVKVSEVMLGGTAYRYMRLLESNNDPISGAELSCAGDTVTTDAKGVFACTVQASDLGGPGTYIVRIDRATLNGKRLSLSGAREFTVSVQSPQYTHTWSFGSTVKGDGGVSAGLIAYLKGESNGGLAIALEEQDANSTADDIVSMTPEQGVSVGGDLGLGFDPGATFIVKAKAEAQLRSELLLRAQRSITARYPQPYSQAQREAQGLLLLDSLATSGLVGSSSLPLIVAIKLSAAARRSDYTSYTTEQTGALGVRVGVSGNINIDAGLKSPVGGTGAVSVGVEILSIGATSLLLLTRIDYPTQWGLRFSTETELNLAALAVSGGQDSLSGRLAIFDGSIARTFAMELIFDNGKVKPQRLELSFSGLGNATEFGGASTAVNLKVTVAGDQLIPEALSRSVNLPRLLAAAQQAQAELQPLQIVQPTLISDIDKILGLVAQASYEIKTEDGAAFSIEPELELSAGLKIDLGAEFKVREVRMLMRERGTVLGGIVYPTERYGPNALFARPGRSWQDLAGNALGGVWATVQDEFSYVTRELPDGAAQTIEASARPAGSRVITGRIQIDVPAQVPQPQLQNTLAAQSMIELLAWTPPEVTEAQTADALPAAAGGFAVGGIYSIQPYELILNPAASLTLTYTDDAAAGVAEQALQLYRWDATGQVWRLVPAVLDSASNTVAASVTQFGTFAVGHDMSGPEITILSPSDVAAPVDPALHFQVLVTDAGVGVATETIAVTVDGVPVTRLTSGGLGEISALPAQDLRAGAHTLTITARDVAGNETTLSLRFKVQSEQQVFLPLLMR